nr:MAG TPA: hypothetical protein [Caudoviricetes sp.]
MLKRTCNTNNSPSKKRAFILLINLSTYLDVVRMLCNSIKQKIATI